MSPETEQILWLLGCVAACWFAAHHPIERRERAITLALLMLANWLFIQSTYSDYGVQFGVGRLGLHYEARTFWGIADFLVALYIVTRRERTNLDKFILVSICTQLISLDMRNYGIVGEWLYLRQLDVALGMILLAFVVGDARGVGDVLAGSIDRGRNLLMGRVAGVYTRGRKQ